jgi:hypothetical protein
MFFGKLGYGFLSFGGNDNGFPFVSIFIINVFEFGMRFSEFWWNLSWALFNFDFEILCRVCMSFYL